MCTGLEIAIPLLTAAVGSGVSMYGAKKAGDEATANATRQAAARNRELDEVMRRNQKIADQSRDVFERREEKLLPSPARAEEAAGDRTAVLTDKIAAPPGPEDVPLAGSAPDVVKSDLATKLSDAVSRATDDAKRLGKLGGYGDYWFGQGVNQRDAARDIDMFGDFQQGNLGILPHSSDFAAYRAYKPASGIGEAFQGLGSVIGGLGGRLNMSKTEHDPISGWTTTTKPTSLKGLRNFWANSEQGPFQQGTLW